MNCPNDGTNLEPSTDPKLKGCLECQECGFIQGFGVIIIVSDDIENSPVN